MSAFADTPTETLKTWLSQALESRQQQMIGPTTASSRDRRVSFDRSKGEIDSYISSLRNEIARRESPGAGGPIVIGF